MPQTSHRRQQIDNAPTSSEIVRWLPLTAMPSSLPGFVSLELPNRAGLALQAWRQTRLCCGGG